MKGQSTIEFLGTILLFIILLTTLLATGTGLMSEFFSDVDQTKLHVEAETITTEMLTNPGYHEGEGTNWHTTSQSQISFGLADEDYKVNREKLESLNSNTNRDDEISYSEFLELAQTGNQYRFNFIWFPMINTPESYTRDSPPEEIENFVEPSDDNYESADNRVHYGSTVLNGEEANFIVTAQDGIYNRIYVSEENWVFSDTNYGSGDRFDIEGEEFEVDEFQNRDNQPGSLVILRKELNEFGAPLDESETVYRFERFAVLDDSAAEDHPLRIEVFAW